MDQRYPKKKHILCQHHPQLKGNHNYTQIGCEINAVLSHLHLSFSIGADACK